MPIDINNTGNIKAKRLLRPIIVCYRFSFISIFRMP
jgi:hypothetical protein